MAIKFSTLESMIFGLLNNHDVYGIENQEDVYDLDVEIIDRGWPSKTRCMDVNVTENKVVFVISEGDE